MKHTTKIILPVLLLLLLAALQNPAKASAANTAKKVFTVNLTEEHPYEYYLIETQRKKPYAKYYADVSVKILEMSGKPDDKVIDTLIYYQAEDSKGSLEYDFDAKKFKKGAVLGKHKLWGWEGLTFNLPKGVKQVKYQITISSKYKVIQRCTEEESPFAFEQWAKSAGIIPTATESLTIMEEKKKAITVKGSRIQSKTFKSSDTKVATVSKKGVVTAKGAGSCQIVVTVKYRREKRVLTGTLVCQVTVKGIEVTPESKDEDAKNASDVNALNAIIAEQKRLGAVVSGDLDSDEYMWSDEGRLLAIRWDEKNVQGNLSLQGLPELLIVHCADNQLTGLDVSNNLALTSLGCDGNQLTSLDLSNNVGLGQLTCSNNQLKGLDISNNPALMRLWCERNQIANIDVSSNTALKTLTCDESATVTGGTESLQIERR